MALYSYSSTFSWRPLLHDREEFNNQKQNRENLTTNRKEIKNKSSPSSILIALQYRNWMDTHNNMQLFMGVWYVFKLLSNQAVKLS